MWWERFPERLHYELKELQAAGIEYERNETAFEQGILQLRLVVEVDGERVDLVATYPDLYPFFRFEVRAPTLSLEHHQNPFAKNLCLIGRATHHWRTTDTLSSLLSEKLQAVLRSGRANDRGEVLGVEQQQAEPVSDYYPYAPSMVVMLGDWTIPQPHSHGTFTVVTAGSDGSVPGRHIRGAMTKLTGSNGEVLAQVDPSLLTAFPGEPIHGSWIRVHEPIRANNPQFLSELLKEFPVLNSVFANRVAGAWLQMWGFVFPEETEWRKTGEGWVFVCLQGLRGELASPQKRNSKRKKKRRGRHRTG